MWEAGSITSTTGESLRSFYKRREHVINLFTWRSPEAKSHSPRLVQQNNYQMLHWSNAGMTFWAVSDLNSADLRDFVILVESRTGRPDPTDPNPGDQ